MSGISLRDAIALILIVGLFCLCWATIMVAGGPSWTIKSVIIGSSLVTMWGIAKSLK